MEEIQEVICTECGWTGDGKGMVACPQCRMGTLTSLDVDEPKDDEQYPEKILEKTEDEEPNFA